MKSDTQKTASNLYYQRNKERCLATSREWNRTHPEEHKAMRKKWSDANKDYFVEYREQHRDTINKAVKRYNAKKRIATLEQMINECTDEAKLLKLTSQLAKVKARYDALLQEYQETKETSNA